MTLEYPNMDPDGMERSVLDWFGQIFLLIFVIEMTSKVQACRVSPSPD